MGIALIDWVILVSTLAFIVVYGIFKYKSTSTTTLVTNQKDEKWWTVCLGVMATQASAITFMSTPGQAFHDGMGFVQFYLGLPLAMILISITFIPMYHKLNIVSAYEYLENRFDVRVRYFTAFLFLLSRGLAAGITIFAPSIILSTILNWDVKVLNLLIGTLVIAYTISGGNKAVAVTQKQQMFVMMAGMFIIFGYTMSLLPSNIGLQEILSIAGKSEKLNILDFSFDPENRYTVWSGLTGGFFLALSYFGTDQSQVQRYISGESIQQSRLGLMWNGILKIPMQFFILMCGVMVFVFFQFNKSPLFFNTSLYEKAKQTEYKQELIKQEEAYATLLSEREKVYISDLNQVQIKEINARENEIRAAVKATIKKAVPTAEANDKDYVFIYFVLKYLPNGLIGILLAVIFCAAMSSSASEISSLGSTFTIDIYKRGIKKDESEIHYRYAAKWFTILWGAIAISFACFGTLFENLIQLVNIIGSLFYGVILGIFLVGFYLKFVSGTAIFMAGLFVEIAVIAIYLNYDIGYLWLNLIGCLGVILVACIISMFRRVENF